MKFLIIIVLLLIILGNNFYNLYYNNFSLKYYRKSPILGLHKESLDQLGNFCEANNMHCFLVAHPTKIPKDKSTGKPEVPTLYNISGSANFYNKTDNGITVYRDWDENKSTVYVQKVKFSHWGEIGQSEFTYMKDSGRYIELSGAYSSESWIKNESVNKSGIEPNNDFLNPFEIPDPF